MPSNTLDFTGQKVIAIGRFAYGETSLDRHTNPRGAPCSFQ
ncbi:hypothetical protein [Streptomyces sp. NPDC001970]